MKIKQTMRRAVQRTGAIIAKRALIVAMGTIVVSGVAIASQSVLGTLPITYAATTPPDSCFTFNSGEIIGYLDYESDDPASPACPRAIDIPATINGTPVTTIGAFAFQNKNLVAVTLPSSLTAIKGYAFDGNQLTSISIPDAITTIETSTFSDNQLTTVTLPANLTTIGAFAFQNNLLASIALPASVTTIDNNAFQHNQLTSVDLPSGLITLGIGVFNDNALTSVTIPESITTVTDYLFSNNQLTSVTLPDAVTSIGRSAFSGNSLESVTLPASLTTIGANAFIFNKLTAITIPESVTTIGNYAFAYNSLATFVIPGAVTTLGDAVASYNYLTSLTIPDSVTSIGLSAFSNNNLSSLTLGNGITAIENGTFSVNKLESVTIPTSVTSIDPGAFYLQNPWGREIEDSSDPTHELWGGNVDAVNTVYNNIWLVQLHTNAATSLHDSLIPEEWYMGDDLNQDGTMSNIIGGHIINPASVTIQYRTSNGTDITPSDTLIGKKPDSTALHNYLTAALRAPAMVDATAPTPDEQQAIDDVLADYYRQWQTVTLSAPTVSGYQLVAPGSPANVSLPNAANTFTFTYGLVAPQSPTPTPAPAPTPAPRTIVAAPYATASSPAQSSPQSSRSIAQLTDPGGDIDELLSGSTATADDTLPCHDITDASLLSSSTFESPDAGSSTLGGIALTLSCAEPGGKGSIAVTLDGAIAELGDVRIYQPIISGRAIDVTERVTLRTATVDGSTKTVLTYPLQDGADLDTDGASNSSIASKLYLVRLAKAVTLPTSTHSAAQSSSPSRPLWQTITIGVAGLALVGGITAGIVRYRRR